MAFAFDELAYTVGVVDRAAGLRGDPSWVATQHVRGDVRVLPLWRDLCLLSAGSPLVVVGAAAHTLLAAAGQHVLLGLDGGTPVFAAEVTGSREQALSTVGADDTADLRSVVGSLPRSVAGMIAYGRGLLHWNRTARFCATCGSHTEVREAGHVRACTGPDCGRLHFPRIEPAVIVAVETAEPEPRLLLARHHGAGPDDWTLLAGFLEIGESLENTVRREVAEEAGVVVGPVQYLASQAWPFPAGVMIGFRATALDTGVAVDGRELLDARWFTRAEVAQVAHGPVDSIGRHLLQGWATVEH